MQKFKQSILNFRKPKDKFSLDNLKALHEQLAKNAVITEKNKNMVIESLRQMAEVLIWGDQHNADFFDFFLEKNVLSYFIDILAQKTSQQVKIQLLQTLSILVTGIKSETSLYYLLSNNHINELITHRFDFSNEEVLAYYISFLKSLSLKLNDKSLQFFFNEVDNDFPLYTEAVKFFNHPDSMVRTAVRNLTLNVYKVENEAMRRFILDKTTAPYFSNIVWFISDKCRTVDRLVAGATPQQRRALASEIDELLDVFYYINDIFHLRMASMNRVLAGHLLENLLLPLFRGSLLDRSPTSDRISAPLALFLLGQVFHIFSHKRLIDALGAALIHPNPTSYVMKLLSSSDANDSGGPAPTDGLRRISSSASGLQQFHKAHRRCISVPLNPGPTQTLALPTAHSVANVKSGASVMPTTAAPKPAVPRKLRPASSADVPFPGVRFFNESRPGAPTELNASAPTPLSEAGATPIHAPEQLPTSLPTDSGATTLPSDDMPQPIAIEPITEEQNSEDPAAGIADGDTQQSEPNEIQSEVEDTPEAVYKSNQPRTSSDATEADMKNKYRAQLLKFLGSGEDQEVLGVTALLYALLRNPSTDRALLERAALYPLRMSRAKLLLNELIGASEDSSPASSLPEPQSKLADPVTSLEPASQIKKNASPSLEFERKIGGQDTKSKSATLPTASRTSAGTCTADSELRAQEGPQEEEAEARGSTSSSATRNTDSEDGTCMESEKAKEEGWVGQLLLFVRRGQTCRLATLQLAALLLKELVYCPSAPPNLTAPQRAMLHEAYARAAKEARERLNGTFGSLFLQLFEDELANFKQLNFEDLITDPLFLLPAASLAGYSDIPLQKRLPVGGLEQTRRAIQGFLVFRDLRQTLLGQKDRLLPLRERPLPSIARRASAGGPTNIRPGAKYQLPKQKWTCVLGDKDDREKRTVYVVVHGRKQLLILYVDPASATKTELANIHAVLPLQNIELEADSEDPAQLRVTTALGNKSPHLLVFPSSEECTRVKSRLERQRNAMQDYKLHQIVRLLAQEFDLDTADEEEVFIEPESLQEEDEEDNPSEELTNLLRSDESVKKDKDPLLASRSTDVSEDDEVLHHPLEKVTEPFEEATSAATLAPAPTQTDGDTALPAS